MRLFKKLENMFASAAFAEAGEHETARQIAAEEIPEDKGQTGKRAVDSRIKSHTKKPAGVTPTSTRA